MDEWEEWGEMVTMEEEERDIVLKRLGALRKAYLVLIRHDLKYLYHLRTVTRDDAYVCSDDARDVLEVMKGVPPPKVMSRSFLGATFKTKDWITDGGMVKSRTKGNHARLQFKWRLRD